MTDLFGEQFTRWTIRLALTCYVFCLAAAIARRGWTNKSWNDAVRIVWTAGCALFVVHVVAAFGYYHHFSHRAAFDDTAKQTADLLGFAFGGGIYFSYLFLAVWVLDVVWRWVAAASRPAWLDWPLHLYMFFIAFNGAIVFEGGVSRWGGIVACVLLAGILVLKACGRRKPPGEPMTA